MGLAGKWPRKSGMLRIERGSVADMEVLEGCTRTLRRLGRAERRSVER